MKILQRIDIDGEPTDDHISVDYYYVGPGAWFSQWQVPGPEFDAVYKVTVTSLFYQVPDDLVAAANNEIVGTVLEALNEALPASLQCQC